MGWKLNKYNSVKEFMDDRRNVNRWFISIIFLIGMFCGVTLATVFYIGAVVSLP